MEKENTLCMEQIQELVAQKLCLKRNQKSSYAILAKLVE